MLLYMGVILAAISFAFEMYIVISHPLLLRGLIRFKGVGILISIALSIEMSRIFGATGMVVMLAGVSSTLISVCVYESGVLHRVDEVKVKMPAYKAQIHEVAILTWKSVVFLWKVFTFPVRCVIWCQARYESARMVIRRIAP